jgi:hypothetical protein
MLAFAGTTDRRAWQPKTCTDESQLLSPVMSGRAKPHLYFEAPRRGRTISLVKGSSYQPPYRTIASDIPSYLLGNPHKPFCISFVGHQCICHKPGAVAVASAIR